MHQATYVLASEIIMHQATYVLAREISIFQSNSGAQLKQEEIELGLPFMVPDLVHFKPGLNLNSSYTIMNYSTYKYILIPLFARHQGH
jgi:hypothetical protein